jgi:DNA-binding transcriptional LysR family regulator
MYRRQKRSSDNDFGVLSFRRCKIPQQVNLAGIHSQQAAGTPAQEVSALFEETNMLISSDMTTRIKLHHLRYFVAIASQGSLHGAARALGLAQPAITKGLRELEEEFGIALVKRHSHGVDLTEAGNRVLVRATSILEDLRRAQEETEGLRGISKGHLTVGLSPDLQALLLPAAYQQFTHDHPGVRLHIMEALFPIIYQNLLDGSMDFYAGPELEHRIDHHFQVNRWWTCECVVAARRGHPLVKATDLADLVACEWIIIGGLGSEIECELAQLFQGRGLFPTAFTMVNSAWAVSALMSVTDHLFYVPKTMLDLPYVKGRLVALPLKDKVPDATIIQIQKAGAPLTPIAESFSNCLQRAYRNL